MTRPSLTLVEPSSPQQVLREAVQSFVQRGRARNLAPRTLEFYTQRLGAFARWLEEQGRNVAPEDVTPALVHGRTSPLANM